MKKKKVEKIFTSETHVNRQPSLEEVREQMKNKGKYKVGSNYLKRKDERDI